MSESLERLEQAKRLAGRGKISRRQFVQLAMAAGFPAVSGELMFVKAARAEPKKGGAFRIGIGHGATTEPNGRFVIDETLYLPLSDDGLNVNKILVFSHSRRIRETSPGMAFLRA